MNINLPQPSKDFSLWASQLIVVLRDSFFRIPEPLPGTIVLWKSTLAVPEGYLQCDGGTYPVHLSPGLRRLLGESTPGNFTVPSVTAPTDTIAIIKT